MMMKAILLFLFSCSCFASSKFYREQIEAMRKQEQVFISEDVDAEWREPLVQWAFDFSYHYGIPYDVVALSTEIFERLLHKKEIQTSEMSKYFSVSYVLAVKLLHNDMPYRHIVRYAPFLDRADLVKAEKEVCELLRWKLYYVIPHSFIRVFNNHLAEKLGDELALKVCSRALWIAENGLYRDRQGLSNYHIALNAIIDSINQNMLHPADHDAVFAALNRIIK